MPSSRVIIEKTMAVFYVGFVLLLLAIQSCVAAEPPYADFDVFKLRLSEDYQRLCPATATCTSSPTSSSSRSERSLNSSSRSERSLGPPGLSMPVLCCGKCSCELDCGTRCCPDMPILQHELSAVDPAQTCIHAQYRPYKPLSLNGRPFLIYSKCPLAVSVSEGARLGCEAELSYANITDGRDLLPVTSLVSGVTYKNRMCAACHGEANEDVYFWEARYMCVAMPMLVVKTPEDMFDFATRYKKCNIIYMPKIKWLPIKSCELTVNTCNVTGEWDVYDAFTEAACRSYESIYDGVYKNVHCYLCNHATGVTVKDICEITGDPTDLRGNAFVSLLNFNALEKSESRGGRQLKCSDAQFYDKWQNVCRPIVCNTGLMYTQGTCLSLFTEVTGINVVVAFKIALVPKPASKSDNLIVADIEDMLTDLIQRAEYHDLIPDCGIHGYIKLNTNLPDLIGRMNSNNGSIVLGDIDYIAVGIKFTVIANADLNVTRMMEEVTDLLRNVTIGGFQVTSRNISDMTFANAYNRNVTVDIANELTLSNPPAWLNTSISYGYDEGGVGHLPLFLLNDKLDYCPTTMSISVETFCPKVVVEAEHFKGSDNSDFIYSPDFKDTIGIKKISFSENGDFLSICLDSYEFLIRNYIPLEDVDQEQFRPLTIVTILCGVMSLISLTVTLIVYCMFPKLRTVPGLNNIGLVLSLIVFLSLMLVNAIVDTMPLVTCRIVGISLHYSLVSSFSWMFVCTLHMARVFATITDHTHKGNQSKTIIHYIIFVQIVSVGVVVATVVSCYLISDGDNFGYSDSPCYVESRVQIYSVAIPVGLVIVLNFAMFAYVIITICRLDDINKHTSHERHNLIIFVKLSTLTGITWIFGFLYQFTGIESFAYAFTIFNASQGVFIMCSFVLNKRVFDMCRAKKEAASSQSLVTRNSTSSLRSDRDVVLKHYNKNGSATSTF